MSVNVEEYLAGVQRLVQESFRTNDPSGGMPVAKVAYVAKHACGDHKTYGFFKFKEVLQELEKRGLIKTGTDSKGAYAIWLPGSSAVTEPTQLPQSWEKFRGLYSKVWFAFVSAIPAGRRFFNRRTGEVQLGASQQLEPADEWVEITALDSESERAKARQFVSEKMPGDAEILAAVESPRWYVGFPRLLRQRNLQLAAEWNRGRSNRVIEVARGWCERNRVDQELVFQRDYFKARTSAPSTSHAGGHQLKSLLLSALSSLTTEELLRLPIPARQLIAVVRPDLLD
jgi:hypothetical protein